MIIIEDDPYYFLQMKEYHLQFERTADAKHDSSAFISSLEPSYLKYAMSNILQDHILIQII